MDNSSIILQYLKTMLDKSTIDSFRPMYANAHVILEEIISVCDGIESGVIKPLYLRCLVDEAKYILQDDILLKEKTAKRNFIISHINTHAANADYVKLKHFINVEIGYFRNNYFVDLTNKIIELCNKNKKNIISQKDLRHITSSYVSECVYNGVSLAGLKVFLKLKNNETVKFKKIIKGFLKIKKFNVYLYINKYNSSSRNTIISVLSSISNLKILEKWPSSLKRSSGVYNKVNQPNTLIICLNKIPARDEFGALLRIRVALDDIINIIKIFHIVGLPDFGGMGLVYDHSRRKFIITKYLNIVSYDSIYSNSGFKKKSWFPDIYNILDRNNIAWNKRKNSASYLVNCLHEPRPINKFLYSWIAIEVLFNSVKQEIKNSKIKELKEIIDANQNKDTDWTSTADYIFKYVPDILSIFYLSKIFKYLITKIDESGFIPKEVKNNFKENGIINLEKSIKYLRNTHNLESISDYLQQDQILVQRLTDYIEIIQDQGKLYSCLNNHNKKIYFQLKRLYRFRNEMTHNGENTFVRESGLCNLTSMTMLSINNQEYAIELIEAISQYSWFKKGKVQKMSDIYEDFSALYNVIIKKLKDGIMSDDEIIKLMEPIEFFK